MSNTERWWLISDVFVCQVDKAVLPIWHKLESLEKRECQLRKCHHRLACGKACREFSWLMINKGGLSSFWVVPPLGGGSWVIQESSLSKPQVSNSFAVFAPVPAVRLRPGVTTLTSFSNESVPWVIRWNKTFPHQVAFDCDVLSQQ